MAKATGRSARGKPTPKAKRKAPAKAKARTAARSRKPSAVRRPAAKKRAPARRRAPKLPMPELLFRAATAADVVEVPERTVVAIEGAGGPHHEGFGRAIGALYGVAYTLRFARKPSGRDFRIGPLEGRWWADGAASRTTPPPIDQWRWRLRLAVPADVDEHELADVIQAATMKKGGKLEGSADARRVGLERIPAQPMGRILHVGPFAKEPRSFAKIDAALAAVGRRGAPAHVEVYLSDPRRTKPAKLRTVLLREMAS